MKWSACYRLPFQIHFLHLKSTEVYFTGSNWHKVIFGSGYEMETAWWKTLIWSSDDLFHSSLHASPILDTVYPKKYAHDFALLCFVVVIHWLIFPYPSGLLHWRCGNLTIAPVPAKQPWWIWINTSCEFIMNDCITTTKQSTTKPCAYFLGYTGIKLLRGDITCYRIGLCF